jgi:hypothetical protein
MEFDDLKYWIQLSLPMNALPQEAITLIENQAAPADQRIQTFARYLYQHWIQRQDSARCSLYFECLSQKKKLYYYDAILATLKDPGTPIVSAQLVEHTKNQAEITIQPCTKIIVTNSRNHDLQTGPSNQRCHWQPPNHGTRPSTGRSRQRRHDGLDRRAAHGRVP